MSQHVRTARMQSDRRTPLVIEPTGERNLEAMIATRPREIEEQLLENGALLFRGFNIGSIEDFDRAMSALGHARMDYTFGSTPRTELGNRIFTATEYPPAQTIPMHNENAYQREWPLKIALCCLQPATEGGETPIADMRLVNEAIGERLLDRFETRGVRYVRHYRPYVDVPWQQVFRTTDKSEVARFCASQNIASEWLDKETLRTTQDCQGVAYHPVTQERVFFNQAHLFHVSSLDPKSAQSMIDLFGRDRLPRHAVFGDGEEISADDLQIVRTAFTNASIAFPWQSGDVILLDNMQFAHGRRPFKGKRQVVAALMQPHSAA